MKGHYSVQLLCLRIKWKGHLQRGSMWSCGQAGDNTSNNFWRRSAADCKFNCIKLNFRMHAVNDAVSIRLTAIKFNKYLHLNWGLIIPFPSRPFACLWFWCIVGAEYHYMLEKQFQTWDSRYMHLFVCNNLCNAYFICLSKKLQLEM